MREKFNICKSLHQLVGILRYGSMTLPKLRCHIIKRFFFNLYNDHLHQASLNLNRELIYNCVLKKWFTRHSALMNKSVQYFQTIMNVIPMDW